MLYDNWTESELAEIADLETLVQKILQAEWPALLPLHDTLIVLPLAKINLLGVGKQFIERKVGTTEANDQSWQVNFPAPNVEGIFVLGYEGWISRPSILARSEDGAPVMVIDRRLSSQQKLGAWLGSLLQFKANRPAEMSDVTFEALLTTALLKLMKVARDRGFAKFPLGEEILSLESRHKLLEKALEGPRNEVSLASWEVARMSIRGVCDTCKKETEFFGATLDPMDPSSLGRAESRIDSEVGHGILATCSHCGGPCNLVRTYMNDEQVDESTPQIFALRYGPKGDGPTGNYG